MNAAQLATGTSPAEPLFQKYQSLRGVYDELLDTANAPRAQWQQFLQLLDALGQHELGRRWEQARQLIHENGVAYNAHGDPHGRDRRWELDALPVVMDSREWTTLSLGLTQRARLLNALLADLYGPQLTIHEGLLPAELIWTHTGFLRACHGWRVPGNSYLHLYSAHVARSPEGAWWVVADRTQAPVGAGYAVENRIVISRMIPHVFHHCQIQRLAGFFIDLRDTLGELAVRHRDSPRVVLLSPGPKSPTYFEDSYLARYLGYTLVEGEDLTVRDNRVFLKTLGGLIGIDVVLRRVSDRDCDPLELDGHSRSGVPGLTQAARQGNVTIANALGSGLVESPALAAFLPALCRRLLDEELQVPSVRSWWCGEDEARQYVLAHLDRLIVRQVLPNHRAKPVHGGSLSKADLEKLAAQITATPSRYVAQDLVVRSTAPTWHGSQLRPSHIALRTFLVARGDSYHVLPGALAHVSASPQVLGESMFISQRSKDVWVRADGPVAPVTLLQPPGTPVAIRRSSHDLPSRVADNLFWLGRQVERAEGRARLLRSILTRLFSEGAPQNISELPVLLRALNSELGSLTAANNHLPSTGAAMELEAMAFLYDAENPSSLQSMLGAMERVATVIRDRISLDSWRILKRIDSDFRPTYPLGVAALSDVLSMLNQMILDFSAFNGVVTENMTRGPGWQFLDLGRRIERAIGTITLLRQTLCLPAVGEHAVLESLLEIADSSMTYRNRYAANLQLAPLLDLLIVDETNPRSIGYQLAAIAAHVDSLPRQQTDSLLSDEQRLAIAVHSAVRLAEVTVLAEVNEAGVRHALDELLVGTADQLSHLASAISLKYLVHAGPAHQLSEIHRA